VVAKDSRIHQFIKRLLGEANNSLEDYYQAFEEKFRGSEEEIYQRLSTSYKDIFVNLKETIGNAPVIDLGCGRGELLKLYKQLNIDAIGVDTNAIMVAKCLEQGLVAKRVDALKYLKICQPDSLGGVSGVHFAEHLPFERLMKILQECFRTIKKDCFILLETPNPENILVGSHTFWHDPSHIKPIPPLVLSFMVEYAGFKQVRIVRMHPIKDNLDLISEADPVIKEMAMNMFGPRDYAIIGYR
jgi:SAM-dependent methyltransferase